MFEDSDIISCYTRDQAIEDGIFVDVSEVAKKHGFLIPVALTSNLYHSHIKKDEDDSTLNNLNLFLKELKRKLQTQKPDSMYYLQFNFDAKTHTDVWVALEAQSPTNPSPALNVMLAEDY